MIKRAVKSLIRSFVRIPPVYRQIDLLFRDIHPELSHPQIRRFEPGNFYSPIGDRADLAVTPPVDQPLPGIDLQVDAQLQLLPVLAQATADYDWPREQHTDRRYWSQNHFYGQGDTLVLYGMMRHFQAQRVIEVGSGFSSALMLDAADRMGSAAPHLTFIEPYPEERLQRLLRTGDADRTRIVVDKVQNVALDLFDSLRANDILLIDSSHMLKYRSDVHHLFFRILPRLQPGVLIHIHDIFYPFEYPEAWLKEGRAWNEIYMLQAFLMHNRDYPILFFNDFLGKKHRARLEAEWPQMLPDPGGAIWLRKQASVS